MVARRSTAASTSKRSPIKAAPTIVQLEAAKEAGKKKYRNAKKTDEAYLGYIKRGKEFLIELVKGLGDHGEDGKPVLETKLMRCAQAFENPPNEYSAEMLEHWLVQKCFNEGLGKSTADGIHAAFIRYWDNMAREKFRGPYKLDHTTQEVSGNPARSANIEDLMKTIKNKAGADGGHRNHAEAIRIEDVRKIMAMSAAECPIGCTYEHIKDTNQLRITTEHLLMRAFISSGFTLWTRNFELCQIQRKHLQLDCVGPAPYSIPHFTIRLENRKGWQKRAGQDGPLEGNTYSIYEQPELHEIDMYQYVLTWLSFVESCLGRKLESEDYIFPYMGVNGVLYPKKEMTHEMIQTYLTSFAVRAGLSGHYTTHSLRRGGAQYRFMYAPLGKRWSLNMVRWWGGWALGEHVDTLVKYLVDSLQSYENGHGDALCPIQREADRSFCGDHVLTNPVTALEVREYAASTDRKISTMIDAITTIVKTSLGNGRHSQIPIHNPSTSLRFDVQHFDVTRPSDGSCDVPSTSKTTNICTPPRPLPLPSLHIPNISRGPGAWKEAVRQWEEGDPTNGLKALKDWPDEWYTGSQRLHFAAKRSQRRAIAEEYNRFDRNDAKFKAAYPAATKGIKQILRAITTARIERGDTVGRTSKNGQPNERLQHQLTV